MSRIKPLGPVELAIAAIDRAIAQLEQRRAELVDTLPEEIRSPKARGYIVDPETGRRIHYRRNKRKEEHA